jgi:Domain of unknown function (DUF4314)
MPTPEQLARIRAIYRPGRRVRLLGFGEPDRRSLEPGTLGTIRSVDDLGTVHVEWDNGVRLGCIVIPAGSDRPDRLEVLDDTG